MGKETDFGKLFKTDSRQNEAHGFVTLNFFISLST